MYLYRVLCVIVIHFGPEVPNREIPLRPMYSKYRYIGPEGLTETLQRHRELRGKVALSKFTRLGKAF